MSEDLSKVVERLDIATDKLSSTLERLTTSKSTPAKDMKKTTEHVAKTELVGNKWTLVKKIF